MRFELTDENKAIIVDTIKAITGLNHLELEFTVDKRYPAVTNERLYISSNDLASIQYPRIFKRLEVGNFGGGWSNNIGEAYNKDGADYWLPIQYHYEHFSGGSNGSPIATFYITKTGKILRYVDQLKK